MLTSIVFVSYNIYIYIHRGPKHMFWGNGPRTQMKLRAWIKAPINLSRRSLSPHQRIGDAPQERLPPKTPPEKNKYQKISSSLAGESTIRPRLVERRRPVSELCAFISAQNEALQAWQSPAARLTKGNIAATLNAHKYRLYNIYIYINIYPVGRNRCSGIMALARR